MANLQLVSSLACIALAFAGGIFTVLSVLERPVWPLMRDPEATVVSDDAARDMHVQLNRFIKILPPSMMTTMASAAVLLCLQVWLSGWAVWAWAVLTVFIVLMVLVASTLMSRIRAVDGKPADGPARTVRTGVGRLAAVHHMGLAQVVVVLAAQLIGSTLSAT